MALTLLEKVALGGFLGWVLESILYGRRYSQVLGGEKYHIPFLPVYGAGAVVTSLVAPKIQDFNWLARGVVYAGALTGLEAASCYTERALGNMSWDYKGQCVDVQHAAAWGAMALLFEKATRR